MEPALREVTYPKSQWLLAMGRWIYHREPGTGCLHAISIIWLAEKETDNAKVKLHPITFIFNSLVYV